MISGHDLAAVLAASVAAALVGAGTGWLLLQRLRRRSILTALVVVALVSVAVQSVTVAVVGWTMLVSGHALLVLLVSLVAAALAGIATSVWLWIAVGRGSAALREQVRRLASGEEPGGVAPTAPAELRSVAAELEVAHRLLAAAKEREQQLESSRRELVAWISHDLRTPLADVRAMAEALEDGVVADKDTVSAYHRAMRLASERLAAMVNDLFELSRIQARALHVQGRTVDLAEVGAEAVELAAEQARRRGVVLVVERESAVPASGDAALLRRAVGNLVANAVRHTATGARVTLRAWCDNEGHSRIGVTDGCGGIPEADLPRLFEVGFRADPARVLGGSQGAGLGLAIARGVVEAHHGELTVENVGPGCRFEISLPRDPASGSITGSAVVPGAPNQARRAEVGQS